MKKLNLSLNELRSEFSIIDDTELSKIKGGSWWEDFYNTHGSGTYSGEDILAWGNTAYGNYSGGGGWWIGYGNPNNPYILDEVIVHGNGNGSTNGGIAFGSENGWEFYNHYQKWDGDMMIDINGQSFYASTQGASSPTGGYTNVYHLPWYNALTTMVSSLSLSSTSAELAADIMKVSLPTWFQTTGRTFSYVGIAANLIEMVDQGFNVEDAAQAAVGVALVGWSTTLGAPVVFIGGVGLYIWELYEQQEGGGGYGGYGG